MKPVLFVTGDVPAYRAGALARLHEREGIEVALFGGAARHGGAQHAGELPFPHRRVRPRELARLAASGRHRAVVVSTAGRLAPVASWVGARRAGTPLIVWASLWAHPRTFAHAFTYLPLRKLYRSADAVVTYGPHVSAYVRARGARNVHVAPQSVDNEFWSAPATNPRASERWPVDAACTFLFVGRPAREKGLAVLLEAWRRSGLCAPEAALVLVGGAAPVVEPTTHKRTADGPTADGTAAGAGIVSLGRLDASELRDIYAACSVLVVPSIATASFREPWGLVVNEAMNRGLAVIASDKVGAVAGGLVRDGANGLVVPAGDSDALARALGDLAADAPLRARLGRAGTKDVSSFSHERWAEGFSEALATLGLSGARW